MNKALRVLLLEDNPADAELVLRELRRAGFEPAWERVETEVDYLRALESEPELVLSDFDLPQFTGLRALELLQDCGMDVPFILISGTIGEERAVAAMKQGASDYLLKDRLARLGIAIHQALAQARIRRDGRDAALALRDSEQALRIAAAELERDRGHLIEAQALAKVGSWDIDVESGSMEWSAETYRIFEKSPVYRSQTTRTFLDAMHPDDRTHVEAALTRSFQGDERGEVAHRLIFSDGRIKFIEQRWQVIRDRDGIPVRKAGTCQDVTERHEAAETLRGLLREKEVLLKEVHHRVKNNLQIISSLLSLEARRAVEPAASLPLKDMQGRVLSMAVLHDLLCQGPSFGQINLERYLKALATQVFSTQNTRPEALRCVLDLTPVQMGIDQALPCGLIVNELVSNSLRHGFADGRSGETRISLTSDGGGVRLCVSDTGVGMSPASVPRSSSLGLDLVKLLTRQIGGTLEIGSGPASSSPCP